jgi:hypothetical protein
MPAMIERCQLRADLKMSHGPENFRHNDIIQDIQRFLSFRSIGTLSNIFVISIKFRKKRKRQDSDPKYSLFALQGIYVQLEFRAER